MVLSTAQVALARPMTSPQSTVTMYTACPDDVEPTAPDVTAPGAAVTAATQTLVRDPARVIGDTNRAVNTEPTATRGALGDESGHANETTLTGYAACQLLAELKECINGIRGREIKKFGLIC